MSEKRSFFAELKRRNVIRFAGLYLVGAWLLTQVTSTVLPTAMIAVDAWLIDLEADTGYPQGWPGAALLDAQV